MRLGFATRDTYLPQPGASSEGSLNGVLPSVWKISASLWSIHNALMRSPVQEGNERIEMGVYFFTFLLIQLDNIIRGRWPHVLAVSGWCMAGVDHVLLQPPREAPSSPPRCTSPWHTPHTSPKLHAHLFQHQLVMWYLKHQIFFPCLSTL